MHTHELVGIFVLQDRSDGWGSDPAGDPVDKGSCSVWKEFKVNRLFTYCIADGSLGGSDSLLFPFIEFGGDLLESFVEEGGTGDMDIAAAHLDHHLEAVFSGAGICEG